MHLPLAPIADKKINNRTSTVNVTNEQTKKWLTQIIFAHTKASSIHLSELNFQFELGRYSGAPPMAIATFRKWIKRHEMHKTHTQTWIFCVVFSVVCALVYICYFRTDKFAQTHKDYCAYAQYTHTRTHNKTIILQNENERERNAVHGPMGLYGWHAFQLHCIGLQKYHLFLSLTYYTVALLSYIRQPLQDTMGIYWKVQYPLSAGRRMWFRFCLFFGYSH